MDPMPPRQMTRDLARSLVASEADASPSVLQTEPATVRVYERLRRQLGAPVGVDGFQALASRALALARSESPRLSTVQVTANGGLRGLGEVESQTKADEDGEAGIILIAQLLGLFLTFLGEATTLRLIEDLRFQVDAGTESAATAAETTDSEVDRLAMAAAFEDLLLEIDRLRSVSERIEILADKHPGMEDGLVSVAGNIRSIATVLDVFTLIRSKAGGPQEEAPNPETNRYMN
jgi:transcriptional antiterminator Rof (Rho-off)